MKSNTKTFILLMILFVLFSIVGAVLMGIKSSAVFDFKPVAILLLVLGLLRLTVTGIIFIIIKTEEDNV